MSRPWFRKLIRRVAMASSGKPHHAPRQRRRSALALEALEDRTVLNTDVTIINGGVTVGGMFVGGVFMPANVATAQVSNTDLQNLLNAGVNVTINTASGGPSAGDLTQAAGATITKSLGANNTLTLNAAHDLSLSETITTTFGQLAVTGTAGNVATTSAAILTGGGDINLSAGSITVSQAVSAGGAGSVTLTAVQSVVVSANVTGGTGGVSITGSGLAALNTTGVRVDNGAVVSATGAGAVTVTGTGGAGTANNNEGVRVFGMGSRITSGGSGTVTVTGTGGSGSGDFHFGVSVRGGGQVTSGGAGTVTVRGTGGASTGNFNYGVFVASGGATITSGGGNVSVTGQGGGAAGSGLNRGVGVENSGQVTAGGSGTVTVTGTGGAGAGDFNNGVYVSTGTITSGGGTVSVTGTGGASTGNLNYGVFVFSGGATITSGGGNVSVTGQGGGAAGSDFNRGVVVQSSGQVTAGGSGTVTVTGTGGAGAGSFNTGVLVSAGTLTSGGGHVSVTGTGGGSGASATNRGVLVQLSGSITSPATLSVTGTRGANTSEGILILGAGDTISAVGLATLSGPSSSDVIIDSAATANFGSLTFNSSGAVSISEDSDTVLTGTSTANSLSLTSAGAITDAAGISLTVTNNATFSGTAITLGDTGTDTINFGSLDATATAGGVTVTEDSDTHLNVATATTTVTLTTAGAILDNNAAANNVSATSAALWASTGIALQTAVSNLEAQTGTGGIVINNTGALAIGGVSPALAGVRVTTSGAVQLNNTGSVSVLNNGEVIRGPGAVTVNAFGAGADIIAAGNNPSIFSSSAIGTVNGTLTVHADDDIFAGSGGARGDIISDKGGALISAGANLSVTGSFVGNISGTNAFVATAGGAVTTLNGQLNTAGAAMSVTATGAVTLTGNSLLGVAADTTSSSGAGAGAITISGSSIALNGADVNAIDLVGPPANVTLTATSGSIVDNNLTDDKGVRGSALTATAVTGIALGTQFTSITATTSGAGAITLTEVDGVTLTSVAAADGPITVTAGGAVVATSVIATTDSDANDVSITAATGNVTVNTVTAGAGALGDVTLTATAGSILDDGNNSTRVTGDQVVLNAPGALIGATGAGDIDLAANGLTAASGNGNQFLGEADNLLVNSLNAGTGTITLTAGAFRLSAGEVISNTSDLTVNSPAELDLNGFSETIDGLRGNGLVTGDAAGVVTLTVGANNDPSASFAGTLQDGAGTLALTKSGTGAQTLAAGGTYTWTGATTLEAGTLTLGGTLSTASANAVTLGGNGVIFTGLGTGVVSDRPVVVNGNTATVSSFAGLTDVGGTAVRVNGTGAALSNNTLSNSSQGLEVSPTGSATMTGNVFHNNTTGINVFGDLTVGANNDVTGATTVGLVVDGINATLVGLSVSTTDFDIPGATFFIQLLNQALIGPEFLDVSGARFNVGAGLQPVSAMTAAQLNTLELKLRHYPDDANVGLILTRTGYAVLDNGNLLVVGTSAADNVSVDTTTPAMTRVLLNGVVLTNPATGTAFFPLTAAGRSIVFGLDGNDRIVAAGHLNAELRGNSGNDMLYGANGADVLYGDEGNDYLSGGSGDDVLVGGLGRDSLYGLAGQDLLVSGAILPSANLYHTYDYLRNTASVGWTARVEPSVLALLANVDDPATSLEFDVLAGGSDADWYSRGSNDAISATEMVAGVDIVRNLS